MKLFVIVYRMKRRRSFNLGFGGCRSQTDINQVPFRFVHSATCLISFSLSLMEKDDKGHEDLTCRNLDDDKDQESLRNCSLGESKFVKVI